MANGLQLVPRPSQHWRVTMYDKYIVELKLRMAYEDGDVLERDLVLLQGWQELKREFQASQDWNEEQAS